MKNDWRDIRDRIKNGKEVLVLPEHEQKSAQIRMSIQKGLLTIEFQKEISWIQMSKAETANFIQALVNHYNQMEHVI